MSNSPLATVKVPAHSSNYSGSGYRKKINNVCLHHMAGVLTAKQCGSIFAKAGRNGSAHYGVGSDGKIGLYVDEKNVAWHAGNWPENQCSVGIEISNSSLGGKWPVSDKTLKAAIPLIADIMKRNGIKEAIKGKTLTWHSMYSSTACPGNYLRSKMTYICNEVNKILKAKPTPVAPKQGDKVKTTAYNDVYGKKLNRSIINDGQSIWKKTDNHGKHAWLYKGKTLRAIVKVSSLKKA